ncbi:hypothetical protein AAF712_005461 [Marasmius tenuissimus]|uniref:PWI domain-containing protein n=1 Tax=Marasmius tenuissimus TaxID=585030 RepID=A0ABR3A364_9AGAR
MKFPPEFDKKVDMRKVNLNVIRPWIAKKVVELVGFEDEVVVEYAMGLLEDKSQSFPDPKKMQINLTGFLTKDTPAFMSALWTLLLEAQSDITGVPRTFVEEKKEELRKARIATETETEAVVAVEEGGVEVEAEEDMMTTGVVVAATTGPPKDVKIAYTTQAVTDPTVKRRLSFTTSQKIPLTTEKVSATQKTFAYAFHVTSGFSQTTTFSINTQEQANSSRSRSPGRSYGGKRRRSVTPPRRGKRSETASRSPPPHRNRSHSHSRREDGVRRRRSPSSTAESTRPPREDRMDVDAEGDSGKSELKIKGQADAEKKKSRWGEEPQPEQPGMSKTELEKRENELKEKALRNKVVRTRKNTVDQS